MKKTKKIYMTWEISEDPNESHWLIFDTLDDALYHAVNRQAIYEASPQKIGRSSRSLIKIK